jgi:hypothetical protein
VTGNRCWREKIDRARPGLIVCRRALVLAAYYNHFWPQDRSVLFRIKRKSQDRSVPSLEQSLVRCTVRSYFREDIDGEEEYVRRRQRQIARDPCSCNVSVASSGFWLHRSVRSLAQSLVRCTVRSYFREDIDGDGPFEEYATACHCHLSPSVRTSKVTVGA